MKRLLLLLFILTFWFNSKVISQTASLISVSDTRAENPLPGAFCREVRFDFKARDIIGAPGAGYYSGVLTFAPWCDFSGNKVHQLNFNDGGLYWRTGIQGNGWDPWLHLVTEDAAGKINTMFNNAFPAIRGTFGHYGNNGGLSIISQGSNNSTYGSGDIRFITSTSNSANSSTDAPTEPKMIIKYNGNVGIGTLSPNVKLAVVGAKVLNFNPDRIPVSNIRGGSSFSYSGNMTLFTEDGISGEGLDIDYSNGDSYYPAIRINNVSSNRGSLLLMQDGGNVLIGKTTQTNTAYKLDVEGTIRAKEVVVNTTGADFVFEPAYQLMSLQELETYLKANRHLPGIAPAAEMQENGVSAGEMQTKLLQKVEELTLYMIELKKTIEDQQKQINELKNKSL